jgi:hypothetical protein
MSRVLVTGLPRSGTTWVANVLRRAPTTTVVDEPDNPDANPLAVSVNADLGWYPVLDPGEESPRYEQLWTLAFGGGWPTRPALMPLARLAKKLPPRVLEAVLRPGADVLAHRRGATEVIIVKSVLVTLCLEWVVARFAPLVVIIERDPLNVIASWLELDIPLGGLDTDASVRARLLDPMGIVAPPSASSRLERIAWCVGVLRAVSRRGQAVHRDRIVVRHEQLCADPVAEFQQLYDRLGLRWTSDTAAYIEASNRPGRGYETTRVAREAGEKWRSVLSTDDVTTVRAVLDQIPTSPAGI